MSKTTDERTVRDRISFLRTLRAVRSFRPDPVPQEVIDDILDVARWSGSASNRQPWEIVVIRERDTLRSLASVDGYAGHLAGAPLGIVLVMAGDRAEQETYDEGRLAERIMLAAHAHGVGSSVGWIVGRGRDAARELLGIPDHKVVRTAISLGYPDEEARGPRSGRGQTRKPLSEIIYQESYA
jgi:nitroreductase